ncbi:hypothetical protein GCM10025866_13200 [Naasia aerilata]|uniref:Uncharacterized protein n=1 Tax=Naasia aerilata TaxID=1162966 RepID=A0ABM8GB17_9MICO|nr:hypothetical protein GCM10025866_13200 [Naasia aerilata]
MLLMGLGMVAGQLIGSLILELVVPTSPGGVQLASLFGIALTLVAVAVTTLDGRKKDAASAEDPSSAGDRDPVRRPRSESASA